MDGVNVVVSQEKTSFLFIHTMEENESHQDLSRGRGESRSLTWVSQEGWPQTQNSMGGEGHLQYGV